VIGFSFEEVRDVFVYCSFGHVVHCFEGFWGDAIEARCFPLFEFVDGTFDFAEGDGSVDGSEAWFLVNEVKDGVVDWSVVVEDFAEV
jgi:hypothetical protein